MPLSTLHQPGAEDPFFTEPFEEGFSFMEGNGGVLCALKGGPVGLVSLVS